MYRMKLAAKLKDFRNASGLTINQVGEAINKSGKTVSAWECGRGQPDADMLLKLCRLYNVDSISKFFDEESAPSLSESEILLLSIFRSMNVEGQKELLHYAEYIQEKPDYKKCNQPIQIPKQA